MGPDPRNEAYLSTGVEGLPNAVNIRRMWPASTHVANPTCSGDLLLVRNRSTTETSCATSGAQAATMKQVRVRLNTSIAETETGRIRKGDRTEQIQ